jgi:ubiquinone/menaquinone biosynthesis C-methylase UbiE
MRRVVMPELLDTDAGTPAEIEQSLRDIGRVNRWFGGTSTTVRLVEQVAEGSGRHELSLLDVGAGPGDVPLGVSGRMQHRGRRIEVTLLDRAASHLPRNGVRCVAGNALALPFRDGSFDLVACALLAHHLEAEEIVTFVNQALRVCRVAVLINDLRRDPLHLALVYAGFPLFRSHMAWHDGIVSVRRAYTLGEMMAMLRKTNAAAVEIEEHYLYRMGAIAWKSAPRSG